MAVSALISAANSGRTWVVSRVSREPQVEANRTPAQGCPGTGGCQVFCDRAGRGRAQGEGAADVVEAPGLVVAAEDQERRAAGVPVTASGLAAR
ncbi:hypothetical protein OHA84_00835 [Streptomyces sp. NBC_00513]|uniref:hypothetical protein n=1 Tax=unclassified Streptomyces TaxID=2593676 RepID=UPI00225730A6|nr:hypothetical protein [Streptomyces sp. NBC_00424]MCX5078725.1 hypothetical protein [Streptomyces sp. NBC_00424]WUD39166.1 hypothetical protein OHA84_00835 [Streptomyces sp. NBC_00513]